MIILTSEKKEELKSMRKFVSLDLIEQSINNLESYAVSQNKNESHMLILKNISMLTEGLNSSVSIECWNILFEIYESLKEEQKTICVEAQGNSNHLYQKSIKLLCSIKNNFDIFNTKKVIESLNKELEFGMLGKKIFSLSIGWAGLTISGAFTCLTVFLSTIEDAEKYTITSGVLLAASALFFGGIESYRCHLTRKLNLLERRHAYSERSMLDISHSKMLESDSLIHQGVNYGTV